MHKVHLKSLVMKFTLFTVSFLLCLILLEVSLRVAGYLISAYRASGRYQSSIHKNQKGSDIILCLGDSYTFGGMGSRQDSYPSKLNSMISKLALKEDHRVINAGQCEMRSHEILRNLSSNLKRYEPKTVILMVGSANTFAFVNDAIDQNWSKYFIEHLKIYKLFQIFLLNIRSRIFSYEITDGNFWTVSRENGASYAFQVNDFDRSLEQIDPLLNKLGHSKENFGNIESAVDWLNRSIEPFKIYINYLSTHQVDQDINNLLPNNFLVLTNEQLGRLAANPKGQELKRAILGRLYAQATPLRYYERFNQQQKKVPIHFWGLLFDRAYLVEGVYSWVFSEKHRSPIKFNKDDSKVSSSLQLCQNILINNPESLEAMFVLGNLYFDMGNFRDGLPWFQKAVEICERQWEADKTSEKKSFYLFFFLSEVVTKCCRAQAYDLAVEYALKGVELSPEDHQFYEILLRAYPLQSKHDAKYVIDLFDQLIIRSPSLMTNEILRKTYDFFKHRNIIENKIFHDLSNDLEDMIQLLQDKGIRIIIMNYPFPYLEVNNILSKAAKEHQIPFIDNCSLFKDKRAAGSWQKYFYDDAHCSPLGHALIARHLFERLLYLGLI